MRGKKRIGSFLAAALTGALCLLWTGIAAPEALAAEEQSAGLPKLEKQSSVKNISGLVEQIDAIVEATDSADYANNGWQLMKEDKEGYVSILRATIEYEASDFAELCREYGYDYGFAVFYYDDPDAEGETLSSVGPILIDAYIDGDSYRYYFSENRMIRRVGPDGTQDNPKTNTFLNTMFQMGIRYMEPGLIVRPGTIELTITSRDKIRRSGNRYMIYSDMSPFGFYVIDSRTKLSLPEVYEVEEGENGFSWYDSLYNDENEMSAMGIFLVHATGIRIDEIYDTYWWD